MRRLLAPIVVAMLLTLLGGLPAAAHGDSRLVAGELTLAPGESVSFDAELHYHRLVGRVDADGPLTVQLIDQRTGGTAFEASPASNFGFNQLIQCCDRAWTPHTLTITNPGTETLHGIVDARLVHDDLAVMAFRAESGITGSVVVMALVWAFVMGRISRQSNRTVRFARSVTWALALVGAVVVLTIIGSIRYGTPGPPALVAILASIPFIPTNPVVSQASLFVGLIMVAWAVAASYWARSRPVAPPTSWAVLGLGLVGSAGVTAFLVATTYGPLGVPLAMGLAATIPVLAVLATAPWRTKLISVHRPPRR